MNCLVLIFMNTLVFQVWYYYYYLFFSHKWRTTGNKTFVDYGYGYTVYTWQYSLIHILHAAHSFLLILLLFSLCIYIFLRLLNYITWMNIIFFFYFFCWLIWVYRIRSGLFFLCVCVFRMFFIFLIIYLLILIFKYAINCLVFICVFGNRVFWMKLYPLLLKCNKCE